MKLLAGLIFSVTILSATDPQPKTEAQARKEAAPKGNEIPKGALLGADGLYRYTDAQGKKWIFHKTPFGIMRGEDVPVDPKVLEAERRRFDDVKASEDGDTIRFERPGPFGVYKWQKKKTELDEMEQAAWDRQRARTAGKQD